MRIRVSGILAGGFTLAAFAVPASAQFNVRLDNFDTPSGNATTATSRLDLGNTDATASPDVINYPENGFPAGATEDNFGLRADGLLVVPTAGTYNFGVNSDDGFVLTITGATVTNPVNTGGTQGPGELRFEDPRGPADTTADFTFAAPGNYALRLDFFEDGGGEQVRLFQTVAAGQVDLGNTAAGALDVVPVPEPASLGLLGVGALGLLARRRRTA